MKNIIGNKYNRWTVLELDKNSNYNLSKKRRWICQCNCGKIKSVKEYPLITNRTKSCGCYSSDVAKISKTLLETDNENTLANKCPNLLEEWDFERNIGISPYTFCSGSKKKLWWKCKNEHSWRASPSDRKYRGSGCPYCSNKKVLKGYNDIATTNPNLVKYFENEEDCYKYTKSSSKEVNLVCPICKSRKKTKIDWLSSQGFSCSNCGDGISYGEKFISNLLKQLNIENISQYKIENKKYDFYVKKYNCIIEVNGMQHYKDTSWSTLKYQKENDLYKKNLAISKGISSYIVLNFSYSEYDYVVNEIKNSKILDLINEDSKNIDFLQCEKYASSSLVYQISKDWNNIKDINLICKKYNLSIGTTRKYLNKGKRLGICDYYGTANNGKDTKKCIKVLVDNKVLYNSKSQCIKECGLDKKTLEKYSKNGESFKGHTYKILN